MRHLDLFTGLGGFSFAAEMVWGIEHEIASFCEINTYCQQILKKLWPHVPIHDDIKTFKGDRFGAIDLITGGFPCQPHSNAGRKRKKADDRYLWPEMLRVIQESDATWVLGENVTAIDDDTDLVLDTIITDLESIGYEVGPPLEIPACAAGARHIRYRTWILAYSKRNSIQRRQAHATKRQQESFKKQLARLLLSRPRPSLSRARDYRGINGLPNRTHRNIALGNAIDPYLAAIIMQAIKDTEECR